MSDQSFTSRLQRHRADHLMARSRSWAYGAALAPLAVMVAAGIIGPRAAFIAAAAALAGAVFWRAAANRAVTARRELLDELILNGWSNVAPEETAERVRELLAPRNRKVLARALENQVNQVPLMLSLAQGTVTAELRRNRAAIQRLASKLRSRDQIDPRGIVAVEKLIRDGGSPLHAGPTEQIAPALARAESMLDRRP